MIPDVARYGCMAFGFANIVGAIVYAAPLDPVMGIGGSLIGAGWFAFGWYGGYPLADTVVDWHPPESTDAVDDMHRQGLRVMRRRRWMTWCVIPILCAAVVLVMPLLMRIGHPELVFLPAALSMFFVNYRYYGSRCPRCGLGFFTRSASRAASVQHRNSCGHCRLSLYAYKMS